MSEPTRRAGMTPFPKATELMTWLAWARERLAGVPEPGIVAAIEQEARDAALAELAPFLRHRATCYLQAVRDNAPDDPSCTCGLRQAIALLRQPKEGGRP